MKAFVGIQKQDLHRNLPVLKLMDWLITFRLKIKKGKNLLGGIVTNSDPRNSTGRWVYFGKLSKDLRGFCELKNREYRKGEYVFSGTC